MTSDYQYGSERFKEAIHSIGYDFRFNTLHQRIELTPKDKKEGEYSGEGAPLTDNIESTIRVKLYDMGYKPMQMTSEVIRVMAAENDYNPILSWFSWIARTYPWTPGVSHDYIHDLAQYFEDEYGMFEVYLKKWLIGAVDKVYTAKRNPVLVLDGPQNIGKSKFAEWICPLKQYFREGAIQPNDKDYKLALTETWVWEIAELENTTGRTEASALKAFLSIKSVSERRPYARTAIEQPAITSFIGTINNVTGFLNDASGSSRFRICKIKNIDWEGYSRDIKPELIWSQALTLKIAGETCDLSKEEQAKANEINGQYALINNTRAALETYFDFDPDNPSYFETANYIREVLQDSAKLRGNDVEAKRIASALYEMGCTPTSKKRGGKAVRGYLGIAKKLEAEFKK